MVSDPTNPIYQIHQALIEQLTARPVRLEDLERVAIEAALANTGSNMMRTARVLGIGRTTLYRKIKLYGIRT